MNRYVSEIKNRDKMVKQEIENKKASLKYYKDMLHPYAKALRRINLQQPSEYQGLDDPRMVERYSTSIAGVELYAWKELSIEKREVYPPEGEERRAFYCFLDIKIEKRSIVQSGQEKETIQIKIDPEVKNWREIQELKDELERREKEILQSIGQIKGEAFEEDTESQEGEEEEGFARSFLGKLETIFRGVTGIKKQDEMLGSEREILEEKVDDEVDEIYQKIKEVAGALKRRR